MPISRSWESNDSFCRHFNPFITKLDAHPETIDERWRPALWDISEGCILYLPPKKDIQIALLRQTPIIWLPENAFNHPVLVLRVCRTGPESAMIWFGIMQSSVPNKYQNSNYYCRVFPKSRITNPGEKCEILRLEGNEIYPSESYAKAGGDLTRQIYCLPWEALRCYDKNNGNGYKRRLDVDSFTTLTRTFYTRPSTSPWIRTSKLWEDFASKYCPDYIAERQPDAGEMEHAIREIPHTTDEPPENQP